VRCISCAIAACLLASAPTTAVHAAEIVAYELQAELTSFRFNSSEGGASYSPSGPTTYDGGTSTPFFGDYVVGDILSGSVLLGGAPSLDMIDVEIAIGDYQWSGRAYSPEGSRFFELRDPFSSWILEVNFDNLARGFSGGQSITYFDDDGGTFSDDNYTHGFWEGLDAGLKITSVVERRSNGTYSSLQPVPSPTTLPLLAAALCLLRAWRSREG
jgi:hypothetical protein